MNNDRRRNEAWVTPIGVGTIGAGQAAHRCRAIAIRCWNEALAMFEGFLCRAFTKAAMIKELLTSNTKKVLLVFLCVKKLDAKNLQFVGVNCNQSINIFKVGSIAGN